jgi:hypothetical protein
MAKKEQKQVDEQARQESANFEVMDDLDGKEVDFNDASLAEALRTGNNSKLPDNVKIMSPYGRSAVDIGAGAAGQQATGDDGNFGADGV